VWQSPLQVPAGVTLPTGAHLRVQAGRSSRARSPNANPETDQWPKGWVAEPLAWLPPKPPTSQRVEIQVQNALLQTRNPALSLQDTKNYSGGINGPCEVFDPPYSYWCSAKPAGGGGFQCVDEVVVVAAAAAAAAVVVVVAAEVVRLRLQLPGLLVLVPVPVLACCWCWRGGGTGCCCGCCRW
jgi:hypothetical protein